MNETLNTLHSRRSIRKFTSEQITDEDLQTIIDAGLIAPSAMNQQSWHITVVQNPDLLSKLSDAIRDLMLRSGNANMEARAKAEDFSPFYNAPTYIMVFGDEKAIAPIHDGTLAIGNMLNAAESLGIGTCWLHAINHVFIPGAVSELRAELKIPEGYIPVGSFAVGQKGITPSAPPRKANSYTILK
jgi:nitroreductase